MVKVLLKNRSIIKPSPCKTLLPPLHLLWPSSDQSSNPREHSHLGHSCAEMGFPFQGDSAQRHSCLLHTDKHHGHRAKLVAADAGQKDLWQQPANPSDASDVSAPILRVV